MCGFSLRAAYGLTRTIVESRRRTRLGPHGQDARHRRGRLHRDARRREAARRGARGAGARLAPARQARAGRGAPRGGRRAPGGRRPRRGRRGSALCPATDAVVHLAAIVGDPACALDPETRAGGQRRRRARAGRTTPRAPASSASCSPRPARTTAAWPTPPCPSPRTACSRRSRSTRSRRSRSSARCSGSTPRRSPRTCLRFATVYGVAPRMRFDLTVNEFTRDLWAGRRLEVFGEQFWRPYVHVRDAARGVRAVARGARRALVAGEVFNVGDSARELPQARPRRADPPRDGSGRGRLRPPRRGSARLQGGVRQGRGAPRIRGRRAPSPTGSARSSRALADGRFEDAFDGRYRNIA